METWKDTDRWKFGQKEMQGLGPTDGKTDRQIYEQKDEQ
jgi:hypothetical protein